MLESSLELETAKVQVSELVSKAGSVDSCLASYEGSQKEGGLRTYSGNLLHCRIGNTHPTARFSPNEHKPLSSMAQNKGAAEEAWCKDRSDAGTFLDHRDIERDAERHDGSASLGMAGDTEKLDLHADEEDEGITESKVDMNGF